VPRVGTLWRRFRLHLEIQLLLKRPDLFWCFQAHRQSPLLVFFRSAPEVRALPCTGVAQLPRYYGSLRLPTGPPPWVALKPLPSPLSGLPRYPRYLSHMPSPLPRWISQVHLSVSSLTMLPSPLCGRVGVHHITFEACSGFTFVTARRITQPPMAALVTRLRWNQLPNYTARQLPDLPAFIWAELSSACISRLRGAPHNLG